MRQRRSGACLKLASRLNDGKDGPRTEIGPGEHLSYGKYKHMHTFVLVHLVSLLSGDYVLCTTKQLALNEWFLQEFYGL